jgi:predicted enzyme related to lactoylglutathione lyase
MSEPAVTISSVVINALDFERLKAFWSELLASEVAFEIPGQFCWLKPQQEGGVSVALQHVDHATEGRNRVHLDAAVTDIAAAVARVGQLGGSLLEEHEMSGFAWKVMADPEGNEFCMAVH